jgi:hypothetical protein
MCEPAEKRAVILQHIVPDLIGVGMICNTIGVLGPMVSRSLALRPKLDTRAARSSLSIASTSP